MSARKSAICLLLALPFLTACPGPYSGKWKERVVQCRQAPQTPIEDAPKDMPAYVPFSVGLLGVIQLERRLDRIEWECIEKL